MLRSPQYNIEMTKTTNKVFNNTLFLNRPGTCVDRKGLLSVLFLAHMSRQCVVFCKISYDVSNFPSFPKLSSDSKILQKLLFSQLLNFLFVSQFFQNYCYCNNKMKQRRKSRALQYRSSEYVIFLTSQLASIAVSVVESKTCVRYKVLTIRFLARFTKLLIASR